MMNQMIVIFCEHRAPRGARGVICPGGIWTCTNPNGHCSCVATCGITRKEHSAEGIEKGISYESDQRKRHAIHLLPA